eukprot:TRINITY_DN515_c0_g1_i1.p1 TRINITY_DN515_c0_g1~~TRINITY_DN515_c0_g1_i1.p1  ORF type:complete len:148 (-),score=35.30 TRINITY_DN515_c0_g1_i1:118-561(-)
MADKGKQIDAALAKVLSKIGSEEEKALWTKFRSDLTISTSEEGTILAHPALTIVVSGNGIKADDHKVSFHAHFFDEEYDHTTWSLDASEFYNDYDSGESDVTNPKVHATAMQWANEVLNKAGLPQTVDAWRNFPLFSATQSLESFLV